MNTAKVTTFLASTALLSAVFVTPAFADTNIRIAGNGSYSDNSVNVDNNNRTSLSQENDTNIDNNVSVNNNTGHNSVSGNTGGNVNVQTGDATSDVNITNQAGMNVARIDGCCGGGNTSVKIEGNGSRSDNWVDVSNNNSLRVSQNNDTDITNNVDVNNNTGNNRASGNTWGDVSLRTGDADSNVNITNEAGKNVLDVNGCCNGNGTNISIVGNGSGSDNSVSVNSGSSRNFDQDNNTDFNNDVDVHNNTGYNNASSDFWWKGLDNYDHGKKYLKPDYDHKDYGHKDYDRNSHNYDMDKYFPVMKYKDYDHNRKSYDNDHKSYDHNKKFYPVSYKNTSNDRCDSDYVWSDWQWKKNCDYGKTVKHVSPVVVYIPVKNFDSHDYDHKSYDKDHNNYDRNRDYGKKFSEGNHYSFAKFPLVSYNRDRNTCGGGNNGYDNFGKNRTSYFPLFFGHGGNTGGSVNLRTGDASSNVNLHNLGSSNYLSV